MVAHEQVSWGKQGEHQEGDGGTAGNGTTAEEECWQVVPTTERFFFPEDSRVLQAYYC